jgi:hypothetical protein
MPFSFLVGVPSFCAKRNIHKKDAAVAIDAVDEVREIRETQSNKNSLSAVLNLALKICLILHQCGIAKGNF